MCVCGGGGEQVVERFCFFVGSSGGGLGLPVFLKSIYSAGGFFLCGYSVLRGGWGT